MCLAGGFYGNLNYTDSWCVPSQGHGTARRGLTSWIQKGALLGLFWQLAASVR